MDFPITHPMYKYTNGALRLYTQDAETVNGHTVGIDVPSSAVFTDTTYAVMTSGTTGLVPSGGTSAKYLRGDATWQTTAAFNTTYPVMTSGNSGLVPASGTSAKFLRGDATWQTTAAINTTYGVATTAAAGLVPVLDNDSSKYLRSDGTWNEPDGKSWTGTSAAYSTLTIDPNMNYFLVG